MPIQDTIDQIKSLPQENQAQAVYEELLEILKAGNAYTLNDFKSSFSNEVTEILKDEAKHKEIRKAIATQAKVSRSSALYKSAVLGFQDLVEEYKDPDDVDSVARYAAINGHADILEWCFKTYPEHQFNFNYLLQYASINHRFNVLESLIAKNIDTVLELAKYASNTENFEVIEWLFTHYPEKLDVKEIKKAGNKAIKEYIDAFEKLHKSYGDDRLTNLSAVVTAYGDNSVYRLLLDGVRAHDTTLIHLLSTYHSYNVGRILKDPKQAQKIKDTIINHASGEKQEWKGISANTSAVLGLVDLVERYTNEENVSTVAYCAAVQRQLGVLKWCLNNHGNHLKLKELREVAASNSQDTLDCINAWQNHKLFRNIALLTAFGGSALTALTATYLSTNFAIAMVSITIVATVLLSIKCVIEHKKFSSIGQEETPAETQRA